MSKPSKAVILSAGLGTRLRPLTETTAKPALPIVGVPSVWYSVLHLLRAAKVDQIAVNLGHGVHSMRLALEDGALKSAFPCQFHLSDESSQILGSAGGLVEIADWLGDGAVCVTNGDSIVYPDWPALLEKHFRQNAEITLHLRNFESASNTYTSIQKDPDGRVTSLEYDATRGRMFTGAYVLDARLLKRINRGVSDFKKELLIPAIARQKVFSHEESIRWFDTGTIGDFFNTQLALASDPGEFLPLIETKMKLVSPGFWIPKESKRIVGARFLGPGVITSGDEAIGSGTHSIGPNTVAISPDRDVLKRFDKNALIFGSFAREFKAST